MTMPHVKTLALAAAAVGLAGAAGSAAAQEIELTLSHFLPPVHGIHTDFIEPWARELEERTDGRVAVEIFPGTAALGNVAQQYDQVVAGVTDIAHGLAGIPRGRFPRTSIMDLPFLTEDAGVASRTLWDPVQRERGVPGGVCRGRAAGAALPQRRADPQPGSDRSRPWRTWRVCGSARPARRSARCSNSSARRRSGCRRGRSTRTCSAARSTAPSSRGTRSPRSGWPKVLD